MQERVSKIVFRLGVASAISIPLAIACAFIVLFAQSRQTQAMTAPFGSAVDSNMMQHLSWQAPFYYEARVYASPSQRITGNPTEFFESAQLLWHIEPQSVQVQHPTFTKWASVDIPAALRNHSHDGSMLFAHIFAQRAGQFAPHPNLTDPFLIHSIACLAAWKQPLVDSDAELGSSQDSMAVDNGKLVAYTDIYWAMLLENHPVKHTIGILPMLASTGYRRRWKDRFSATYNPLLFLNSVSRSRPKEAVLAASNTPVPQSFNISLELVGLSKFRISAKTMLLALAGGQLRSAFEFNNALDYMHIASSEWVHAMSVQSGNLLQHFVHAHSVVTVLAIIISIHLLVVLGTIALVMSGLFWVGPASNWIGVSRTSIGMMLANDALRLAQTARHSDSIISALLDIPILINMWIMIRMTDIPLNPAYWLRRLRTCTNPNTRLTTAQTSSAGMAIPAANPLCQLSPHNIRIVIARSDVDATALRWVRLLGAPVVVAAALLTFVKYDYCLLSWDFAEEAGLWISYALVTACLVPQIALNYRLRLGSLLPPADYIFAIAAVLGERLFDSLASDDDKSQFDRLLIPYYACNIIILLQWIRYYKPKQH